VQSFFEHTNVGAWPGCILNARCKHVGVLWRLPMEDLRVSHALPC
jgi:hypothetical protein